MIAVLDSVSQGVGRRRTLDREPPPRPRDVPKWAAQGRRPTVPRRRLQGRFQRVHDMAEHRPPSVGRRTISRRATRRGSRSRRRG